MIEVIWTYVVRAGREADFERAYNADGDWATLFRNASDYHGTRLLRSSTDAARYATIDCWTSQAAYDAFRVSHAAEYEKLDRETGELTADETCVGSFEVL